MRIKLLIAAAGLTGMVAGTPPARAQYYGWGYYRPIYPVPYGYYPAPYYAPPPIYDAPPRHLYRHSYAHRIQHRTPPARHRVVRRTLVNPLLGPLPGAAWPRRN